MSPDRTPHLDEIMNEWEQAIWQWLEGVPDAAFENSHNAAHVEVLSQTQVQQARQRYQEAIRNNMEEMERLELLDELDEIEDQWIKQVQAAQPVEGWIAQWPPDEFVSRAHLTRHNLWYTGIYQDWYRCDRTGAIHFISKPWGTKYWLMDDNGHHVVTHN